MRVLPNDKSLQEEENPKIADNLFQSWAISGFFTLTFKKEHCQKTADLSSLLNMQILGNRSLSCLLHDVPLLFLLRFQHCLEHAQ